MKIRLKTMFTLTAVAGLCFFLARLNPWLPALAAVMFGPATAAFLWRPSHIPAATGVALGMLLGSATAMFFVPQQHWGFSTPTTIDGPVDLSPHNLTLVFGKTPLNMSLLEIAYQWTVDFQIGVATMASGDGGALLSLSLHLLLILVAAYGITLCLLARWLGRQEAK